MARIADSGCAARVTQDQPVARPHKKNEYLIVFGSRASQKGWTDLKATKQQSSTHSLTRGTSLLGIRVDCQRYVTHCVATWPECGVTDTTTSNGN